MTKRPAFIALVSILIISAIATVIAVGLLLRAIGENQMAVNNDLSQRAQLAATSCAEYALGQLRLSNTYAGNATLIVDSGDTCHIGVPGGSGNTNRTLVTTSTILDVTQTENISITQLTPQLKISSWQDVIN
jgi:hypothetical protein